MKTPDPKVTEKRDQHEPLRLQIKRVRVRTTVKAGAMAASSADGVCYNHTGGHSGMAC